MADQKLQQLIETLKKQGVESGEESSRKIIDEAKREAEAILSRAQSEAGNIVEQAEREAQNRLRQLQSSMEIAASQFVTSLKRTLEENFIELPLRKEIQGSLSTTDFVKELMKTVVQEYALGRGQTDVLLVLSKEQQEKLKDFAVDLVRVQGQRAEGGRQGVTLQSDGIAFGFMISPADGSVRLDFTDDAFLALFLRYLTPRFRELFQSIKIGDISKK
jgi:V/A-type H+-transporting ATPase subunit E